MHGKALIYEKLRQKPVKFTRITSQITITIYAVLVIPAHIDAVSEVSVFGDRCPQGGFF